MKALGVGLLALSFTALSAAEDSLLAKDPAGAQKELEAARELFGWQALAGLQGQKIGSFLVVILGAAAVGVFLAYHPFAGHRASVEDLDQPKIIITYTVVGALVAIVVSAIPDMAFAIFGIGGLMRFRTELGAAKETGRVILATLLGLACGLQFWMVAILGALIAWILIWILESRVHHRLSVRGLQSETLAPAAEAYARVLGGLGCTFAAPRRNPLKGQVAFVLRAPRRLSREKIESQCEADVPKELRGTLDWPEE